MESIVGLLVPVKILSEPFKDSCTSFGGSRLLLYYLHLPYLFSTVAGVTHESC